MSNRTDRKIPAGRPKTKFGKETEMDLIAAIAIVVVALYKLATTDSRSLQMNPDRDDD